MDSRVLYSLLQNTSLNYPYARIHITTPQEIIVGGTASLIPNWGATDFASDNVVIDSSSSSTSVSTGGGLGIGVFGVETLGVDDSYYVNMPSPSGIIVPLQGYYLVQSSIKFSSTLSSTYSGPEPGAIGRVDVSVSGSVVSRGSAIAQGAVAEYASTVSDVVFARENAKITVSLTASAPTGLIAVWAGTSDSSSSYLSVSYIGA
jgi:hypothetical protein